MGKPTGFLEHERTLPERAKHPREQVAANLRDLLLLVAFRVADPVPARACGR